MNGKVSLHEEGDCFGGISLKQQRYPGLEARGASYRFGISRGFPGRNIDMRFNAEKGKSILVLVTVVGVLSLLLSILGEKVIGLIVNRNNAAAAATLKTIATGLENYGKEHGGEYPDDFAVLTKGQPPYIDRDYLAGSPHNGFNYFCSRLDKTGYNCSAIPLKCGISGSKNYAVATGNLFVSEDCDKNE